MLGRRHVWSIAVMGLEFEGSAVAERIDVGGAYAASCERFRAWGRTLDDAQAATPVPALPGWTVKDTFAHVTALATQAVGGEQLEGVPGEDRTQAGVDARAHLTLAEVLDEWDDSGPRFAVLLTETGRSASPNPAIDVWTHEVDARGALAVAIPADGGDAEAILTSIVRRGLGRRWPEQGIPALRVVLPDDEWVAGDGEPAGVLRTDSFEIGRVFLGRRSPAQLAALGWEASDPSPWIGSLCVFGPATTDVVDSPRAVAG
jgi:uncharacterized protein (TIGR03083 family)